MVRWEISSKLLPRLLHYNLFTARQRERENLFAIIFCLVFETNAIVVIDELDSIAFIISCLTDIKILRIDYIFASHKNHFASYYIQLCWTNCLDIYNGYSVHTCTMDECMLYEITRIDTVSFNYVVISIFLRVVKLFRSRNKLKCLWCTTEWVNVCLSVHQKGRK